MALTKISGGVIQQPINVGIITATSADFSGIVTAGSIIANTATFSGNVSIAGSLTYEDVTNIDSIGIVTARSTIDAQSNVTVGAGLSVVGVSTFNNTLDAQSNVTVGAGLSVVGVSTFTSNIILTGVGQSIGIGTASPRVAIDAAETTNAIALPQGTTAQRPTGNNPYIRYNTTNSALEFYNGTDWVEIISDYFPTGSVILG